MKNIIPLQIFPFGVCRNISEYEQNKLCTHNLVEAEKGVNKMKKEDEDADKYYESLIKAGTDVASAATDLAETTKVVNRKLRESIDKFSNAELLATVNTLSAQAGAYEKLIKRLDEVLSI